MQSERLVELVGAIHEANIARAREILRGKSAPAADAADVDELRVDSERPGARRRIQHCRGVRAGGIRSEVEVIRVVQEVADGHIGAGQTDLRAMIGHEQRRIQRQARVRLQRHRAGERDRVRAVERHIIEAARLDGAHIDDRSAAQQLVRGRHRRLTVRPNAGHGERTGGGGIWGAGLLSRRASSVRP